MRIGGTHTAWIRSCVLLLLAENPAHGYELLGSLESLLSRSVDSGTLYRVLRRLDHDELTVSEWEEADLGPIRRIYELTPAGNRELRAIVSELDLASELIAHFLAKNDAVKTSP
jgi:DNA-binding PadR family transcriptional regulator